MLVTGLGPDKRQDQDNGKGQKARVLKPDEIIMTCQTKKDTQSTLNVGMLRDFEHPKIEDYMKKYPQSTFPQSKHTELEVRDYIKPNNSFLKLITTEGSEEEKLSYWKEIPDNKGEVKCNTIIERRYITGKHIGKHNTLLE